MKSWMNWSAFLLLLAVAGCGAGETVMPEGDLTEEQKAAIKAEDDAVDAEESGE